jgi:response regulator RpfG family c-di-GMP phosphodiesterase
MTSTMPMRHDQPGEPSVEALLTEARDIGSVDLGRARSLVQQARVLARSRMDATGESKALYRLAELCYASGLSNEAFAVALEARDLAHQCGAVVTQVSALNLIAAVQYHAANFSEAMTSALTALELYRTTDERSSEGMLLNSLAVIQHSLRDTDRAIVTYEAALMANKGENRPDLDAITLANMAKVRAERHEDLLAVSLGESALDLAKDHAPEFVPEILARLAMTYVALSALDRAASCLDEADGVLRERTARRVALSPGSVVTVRLARGELYVAQHLRDHALREWGDALELATQASMTEVALGLREKLAGLCKDMGRFEQALVHQEARYALNDEMFNRGTDLRIKTLQIQHDTEAARQKSEILRLRTTDLEQMVAARTEVLEAFQYEAMLRVAALAARREGSENGEHAEQIAELSGEIAAELGESEEFVQLFTRAARLYDIGMIGVVGDEAPGAGRSSSGESTAGVAHVTIGAELLAGSSSPVIQLAAEVALSHHEHWNGNGYPSNLVGPSIPLGGRIVAVADAFGALTRPRPGERSWTMVDAINHIASGAGARFEPSVVRAFTAVMVRRHPQLAQLVDRSVPA